MPDPEIKRKRVVRYSIKVDRDLFFVPLPFGQPLMESPDNDLFLLSPLLSLLPAPEAPGEKRKEGEREEITARHAKVTKRKEIQTIGHLLPGG